MGPFVLPQPGITGRYLQQECGAAASVRAGIPHPFKCAAAAVQLLSHPLLSHPQTHPVGVRTCYHTLFLSPPLIYHPPKHTLWVFGRPITPPGLSHPPWAPASCTLSPGVHKISPPPQDTTPGDNVLKFQNVHRGVLYCVRYGMLISTRPYNGHVHIPSPTRAMPNVTQTKNGVSSKSCHRNIVSAPTTKIRNTRYLVPNT